MKGLHDSPRDVMLHNGRGRHVEERVFGGHGILGKVIAHNHFGAGSDLVYDVIPATIKGTAMVYTYKGGPPSSLLSNNPNNILIAHLYPDGRLGLINRAFEELTGYSADELRSIDWALILNPPEWRVMEREKLAELHRTNLPVRYEKEYIRKDGTRVRVELLVPLVTGSGGDLPQLAGYACDLHALGIRERGDTLTSQQAICPPAEFM